MESLGECGVGLAKPRYGRPEDGKFRVSPGGEHIAAGVGRRAKRACWLGLFDAYRGRYSDLAGGLDCLQGAG